MFRKADLGGIILAKSFYGVLYSPEVPDGEGAPAWTTQRVKQSSDNRRKAVSVRVTHVIGRPETQKNKFQKILLLVSEATFSYFELTQLK